MNVLMLCFVLLFSALLMALPYWRFRFLINKTYKSGLMQHFRLEQSSSWMLEGNYEGYVMSLLLMAPDTLFERIRIRVMLEYKPEPGIAMHEKRIRTLRQNSPYQWTANLISKDMRFVFSRPDAAAVESVIRNMADTLKMEGFKGISKSDSKAYGAAWDSGCYGR